MNVKNHLRRNILDIEAINNSTHIFFVELVVLEIDILELSVILNKIS